MMIALFLVTMMVMVMAICRQFAAQIHFGACQGAGIDHRVEEIAAAADGWME
jgi:hypothetical protein